MSTDAMTKAERRRLAREQAQDTVAGQATADMLRTPGPKADPKVIDAKTPEQIGEEAGAKVTQAVTRRESTKTAKLRNKAEAAARAAAQAARDAIQKPAPVRDDFKPGTTPPLHVLNQRAKQADHEMRDAADVIAKDIGRFTRDKLTGVDIPASIMRSRRYRDAVEKQQAILAKKAATQQG